MAVLSPWQLHRQALQELIGLWAEPASCVALADPGQVTSAVDLVLVDMLLPDLDAVVADLARVVPAVLIWGGFPAASEVGRWNGLGARGFVSALAHPEEVHEALSALAAGSQYLPVLPETAATLGVREVAAATAYAVTWPQAPRAEVAARLGVSENTLKAQLASVRRKLDPDAGSRAGLRRYLYAQGYVGPKKE
ncbi:hypothetical protein ACMYYO_06130 [Dermacoccaceae bacterium W4C1]